ncbi:MAG: glycine C-acetyltransferase [Clostridia bacterium]|nr:glycine C-acetyltransferase [Clostridia bacterium]
MYKITKLVVTDQLNLIKRHGLWKEERIITTPQANVIDTTKSSDVINFCANNYLGLANNKDIIEAAKASYDKYGFGLSSVRFICGTQTIHKELEGRISRFMNTDDTILYSSCFDANGGLFETLTTNEDAIISDELNHASIIDGVRLSKATRYRYKNSDMEDLERQLVRAEQNGCRQKIIVTDGVFSMDGIIANLKGICDLADKYDALVVVDDSHATGIVGKHGRGTIEYCDVMGRVDIVTGTFGKAMGGASGGFTTGRQEIIDLLRQRSRPYLFSNTLAPSICAATLKVLDILEGDYGDELREKAMQNAAYFRKCMEENSFNLVGQGHPIVPIMLYDSVVASTVADKMLQKGIYVVGFYYPVVAEGLARIRTQMSAAHTKADIDKCVQSFIDVRKEIGFTYEGNTVVIKK